MKKNIGLILMLSVVTILSGGCAKKEEPPPRVEAANDTPPKHTHVAPHGGTLVEIAEHTYMIEFVRDAAAGKLSAYILDGHAENFIRIAPPSFDVNVTLENNVTKKLTLMASANAATGEKVGDTALFETQADWLKTTETFDGSIARLNIRGTSILNVAFNFPKGNEDL